MKAPRRWIDDPDADPELRDVVRGTPRAAGLDDVTRRRLAARVARASVVPAVAAGWLFVKSAGAALGVVLGAGAVASYAGVVPWSASVPAPRAPAPAPRPGPGPTVVQPRITEPAHVPEPKPDAAPVNPTPSLPIASASSSTGSLSLEVALLEQARREMRVAPAIALSIAREHEDRYPRGQLSAERTLIQIEALHRMGRDDEAVRLAQRLLGGASRGLYSERVRKLLGDRALQY